MSYNWRKPVAFDEITKNLDKQKIEKIRTMARLNELNIFYDKNKLIIKLCDELLNLIDEQEKT
tara:strand:- start:3 stop:191 length:189 start_codon:yes stop_codon:yes gene_type:complete